MYLLYTGLSFCGKDLYKNITIMEKNMLTVSQDICGYPKPDVKWVWKGNVTLKHSSYYTALDGVTKQYRYEFKTQSLTRADCGKQIILIGKNQLGTIRRKSSVDVVCKLDITTLFLALYKWREEAIFLDDSPLKKGFQSLYEILPVAFFLSSV